MAGHSKWANTKHRKAAVDAKRAKVFTRILKEITVAAKMGGGDVNGNPRLRNAVQEARANNVPNDTVERAIKKGTGELEGVAYEEMTLEGYGPGGVAVLVECLTDNRNRTVGEVRHLFSKHGGSLGENGCVAWMFDRRGVLLFESDKLGEEELVELAVELEVEDFSGEDGVFQMMTSPETYSEVLEALQAREDLELVASELAMVPQSLVTPDEESTAKTLRLMESLDEHDDVQNAWANYDVPDELLERVS